MKDDLDCCVSEIETLPSAQPEQSESEDVTFWKKRAREYEEMVKELTGEMARGIKIDSVLLTEKGIVFKKKKPEQRWIPCSERLPKYGEPVLWCNEKGSVFTTAITFVNERGDFAVGKRHRRYSVVAWQPLPEPYKGEK